MVAYILTSAGQHELQTITKAQTGATRG